MCIDKLTNLPKNSLSGSRWSGWRVESNYQAISQTTEGPFAIAYYCSVDCSFGWNACYLPSFPPTTSLETVSLLHCCASYTGVCGSVAHSFTIQPARQPVSPSPNPGIPRVNSARACQVLLLLLLVNGEMSGKSLNFSGSYFSTHAQDIDG